MNTIYQLPELDAQDENEVIVGFEDLTDTLVLDDVEISLDLQLGDDDLGVSLLLESLEQQYEEMLTEQTFNSHQSLNLQSAKEWLTGNKDMIPGLFRYLKSLSGDQAAA